MDRTLTDADIEALAASVLQLISLRLTETSREPPI